MNKKKIHNAFLLVTLCLFTILVQAQKPSNVLRGMGNKFPTSGGSSGSGGGNDSLRARNKFEDSVTVTFYFLDSSRGYKYDSSINDFTKWYPIPSTHVYLGNSGVATHSILFSPLGKAGWDPGFHALDVYKWKLENIKFYNTTRPYTVLGYMLASRAEQMIEILHTQNIRPGWNFSLNYRLINSPGFFRNQKTNHNNYLFTSWYQSHSKRYNNYFALLGNQLQSGENGGITSTRDLDSIDYAKDRFLIPTQIGGDPAYGTDFFSTTLYTGNRYREFNVLLRQQFDFGRKDSVVTDSTVIPLFFPRLRFEHTFKSGKYSYQFKDFSIADIKQNNVPDSTWYKDHYNVMIPYSRQLQFRDQWKEISNDFSIYQFPDATNQHQFIKAGAEIQLLRGNFYKDSLSLPSASLYNFMAHGEYRNLTKNKKWDLVAFGKLYLGGYNSGDYHAFLSLERWFSQKTGSFQLGFENSNRSPSFNFDVRSGFYLDQGKTFNKENTTHLFGSVLLQKLKMGLSADYYLIGNYLYLKNYYLLEQEKTIFNVVRINAYKTFTLGKHWNLVSEVYVQQKTGNVNLNFPALYTRNRLMYEGNLGFKNLKIAMGLEARYHIPYKADKYSPVLGQFFYQDSLTISNLPDVHAFLHFRIKSFKAYLRAENLNTARLKGGFKFNNNNMLVPGYPTPGLLIRFGVLWSFVN